MPPKKQAADSADPPQSSSNNAPAKETAKKTSEHVVAVRKPTTHPSTANMVKEALKALDSRKGVSSQAVQNYIKQKYPSVELVRLKYLVRRALKKGIENGTLVRPVNARVTTGALGKFRLAPKIKGVKSKSENADPNVHGAKKTQTKGATKKKKSNENAKSTENPKPPKNPKKDEAAAPLMVPSAKKPKAQAKGGADGTSKPTKKTAKMGKKSPRKAVKTGSDAPASKAAGKRVKKTE
ncbi:linker histone H1M [Anableps anableps]